MSTIHIYFATRPASTWGRSSFLTINPDKNAEDVWLGHLKKIIADPYVQGNAAKIAQALVAKIEKE
ncbi:hypothetical protein BGZ65_011287, partial [Modicella reniformis]